MMTYIIFVFFALLVQFVCSQFDPTTHRAWKLMNEKECGIRTQQRVFGGQDATLGEFPWIARILGVSPGNSEWSSCAGAIISRKFVLTAAHCNSDFTKYTFKIAAGELDTRTDPDCDYNNVCALPVKKYEVEKVIKHPEYNKSLSGFGDLALIKIKDEFDFNDFVAPICLEYGDLLSENYAGSEAEFAGWGYYKNEQTDPVTFAPTHPKVLQKITLHIQNKIHCTSTLEAVIPNNTYRPDIKLFICARGRNAGEYTFFGDSGGMLVIPKSVGDDIPRYFGIGILSFMTAPDENARLTSRPGLFFSKVSFYLEWILDTMANESGL